MATILFDETCRQILSLFEGDLQGTNTRNWFRNIELNRFRRFHNVLVYYDFQRGMMQHYQIGQLLRKRYMTDQIFLNETYDRDEVCKEHEKCY